MKFEKKQLALGLTILSIYSLLSLLPPMAGEVTNPFLAVLAAPGIFLFRSFLWAAFYVPAFLAGCVVIIMQEKFRPRLLFSMAASVFPMLFLALALRILIAENPASLVRVMILAFGKTGSTLISFLMTLIGAFLIYRLGDYFFGVPHTGDYQGAPGEESAAEASSAAETAPDEPVMPRSSTPQGEEPPLTEEPSPSQATWGNQRQSWDTGAEFIISSDTLREDEEKDLTERELRDDEAAVVDDSWLSAESYTPETEMTDLETPVADPQEMSFLSGLGASAPGGPSQVPAEADRRDEEAEIAQRLQALASQLDGALDEGGSEEEQIPEEEQTPQAAVREEGEITEDDYIESEDALDEDFDEEEDEVPIAEKAAKLPPVEERDWNHYTVPIEGVLEYSSDASHQIVDEETKRAAQVLEETLEEFRIKAEVTGISKGPVITMFELLPSPGVKLSKITGLADNIALRLAASRVRIVAPIPGKHAVGIEIPNKKRELVSFQEMITSEEFQSDKHKIPIILGKDIGGDTQVIDLAKTPHLLIAGATGSGKSVCVNSLISSILYQKSPEDVRLMLVDPKIVELKFYNDIPHLLTPVITDPKRAFQALQYCLSEMERRYSLLDALGVRDIESYNRKIIRKKIATTKLPYIVVVVDEFADLMAVSGKELEGILARLAAMSRAVGIHLVLATQRPSIDVITGLIKANFPSRIAFMVASKTDSRIILDSMGAEKLLGRGDMLFTSAWDPYPSRIQGAFLAESEVERVVEHVKTLGEPDYIDDEIFFDDGDEDDVFELAYADSDPLYNKAVDVVVQAGKASASYLQRRLKIGYNRAARLVEEMEDRGIVGPQNGSKPREVIHVPERVEERV